MTKDNLIDDLLLLAQTPREEQVEIVNHIYDTLNRLENKKDENLKIVIFKLLIAEIKLRKKRKETILIK